jgi:hypothetical protein
MQECRNAGMQECRNAGKEVGNFSLPQGEIPGFLPSCIPDYCPGSFTATPGVHENLLKAF